MSKLSGKALADRARELDIPGRSKMSADDLRDAVTRAERTPEEKITEQLFGETVTESDEITESDDKPEPTSLVPNRADVRKFNRARKLRNDGTPRGGYTPTFNRADRMVASVKAGERGKFYGRRTPDARRVDTREVDTVFHGPRTVPVNVIHEGH